MSSSEEVQWQNSREAEIGESGLGIQECKKWPNYGLSQAYGVKTNS